MKKKFIPLVMVLICVIACAFSLTACKNNDQEPYYGRTYTLTGTCTVDWETKLYRDNYKYADNDDHSQKELLEKYWDAIDWDLTLQWAQLEADAVPHGSVAEFMAIFEETEQNLYSFAQGLQISVSDKSDPKLTVSFPTGDVSYFRDMLYGKYDAKLTMPLYESDDKLAQNKPFDSYDLNSASYDNPGYCGLGVYKAENGHVLTVRFSVQKFVKDIDITIIDYFTETVDGESVVTQQTVFQTQSSLLGLFDSDGNSIMYVNCRIDFEVENNK